MAQPRVRPLERKVLRDTVYESLVDMLMSGALLPEAPLSIDGLASELAVSPTPVREALVHLERTGHSREATAASDAWDQRNTSAIAALRTEPRRSFGR